MRKDIKIISGIVILIIIISIILLFLNSKSFKIMTQLSMKSNGKIEITDSIRKIFSDNRYFASILGANRLPSNSEILDVSDVLEYEDVIGHLFFALRDSGQLKKYKNPMYVNKGNGYLYEYRIKRDKFINILDKVFNMDCKKEELSSSEKYVNSLYYNEKDDYCYFSNELFEFYEQFDYMGVISISKNEGIYTMELNHYKIFTTEYDDISLFLDALEKDILLGNYDEYNNSSDNVGYTKKKVTFKINSLFGKNKFKILSVENINN